MDITKELHLPRWTELPDIPLYLDQVVLVLEEALSRFGIGEGKDEKLTSSMISNYVKKKLLPSPEKKKYKKEHLAAIVMISVLKVSLSLDEIGILLDIMRNDPGTETGYDFFCQCSEIAVGRTFEGRRYEIDTSIIGDYYALVDAAVLSLSGRIYAREMFKIFSQEQQ